MTANNQSNETIYQLVSFVVEDEEFGVDILKVQEIIRTVDITRVPKSPEFVEGVINLRGKIVPVIDLRIRFGIAKRERDNETRIIVVELSDRVVGFLVDKVKEVIRVEKNIIEPPPELTTSISSNYITGVAKLQDRLLILLDLDKVLSGEEQEHLSEVETGANL
ncbi:MAG: chemotaxis protein CheW [Bacteroidetes bacterium]|nr:chemotaxis protein CheW [Bacteroidota bacterium]MCL5035314.1 chemotaxis protein CheW [Bacteroidota bacterium]